MSVLLFDLLDFFTDSLFFLLLFPVSYHICFATPPSSLLMIPPS